MDSGYYAACAGLSAKTQALELVANNLANVNTTGYRAHEATFRSLLAGSLRTVLNPLNRAINDFGATGGSRLDLSPGNMEQTGNPLDLAIEGKGFFVVQRRDQALYTRNGSFQVSAQGRLITAEGDPVLGEQGPVLVPSGKVSVGPDGTLSVDGSVAGKLRIVQFAPDAQLTAAGAAYYSADKDTPAAVSDSGVRQGMLEASNVSGVTAAVSLITVQRHAEMLQRALSAFHTEFNRIAAGELARV
ncbi:MAG TPA: flagellar basal-body rod protein FlgF [Terriglobales bacterium]|jgi:flagellar basal-body rod protein FlgF/flagellar basal-body rod protein FlgG